MTTTLSRLPRAHGAPLALLPAAVLAAAILGAALAAPPAVSAQTAPASPASVAPRPAAADAALIEALDSIFAPFAHDDGPGCAVGVARRDGSAVFRGYGMADLEHGVPITPETVFEAGSVSKQFTAAATILLALEGRLSLDDDIRDYIPEVPDYGETITIRHLLNHTSGLRDWGTVAAIEGWPRGTRAHTHEHVLDIAARQRALNHPPGERYSYTNTGYNLQAVLVERVTGTPFAEFSRARIFEPLGLEHTRWRDDHRRVVAGRAQAYTPTDDGARLDMPFEDVHGNGGLLTTVGDLLAWTATLETGELGGAPLLEEMHRRATLSDGERITYASGLRVDEYRGVPEVAHSGATAGYRAYLARYPEQGAAVALLCNTAAANPTRLARAVADVVLGDALRPADDAPPGPAGSPATSPQDPAAGEAAEPFEPAPDALAAFVGSYRSDEAEAVYRVELDDGVLWVRRRFGPALPLRPLRADAFESPAGTVWFERDGDGRVVELHLGTTRVWDMTFRALPAATAPSP